MEIIYTIKVVKLYFKLIEQIDQFLLPTVYHNLRALQKLYLKASCVTTLKAAIGNRMQLQKFNKLRLTTNWKISNEWWPWAFSGFAFEIFTWKFCFAVDKTISACRQTCYVVKHCITELKITFVYEGQSHWNLIPSTEL